MQKAELIDWLHEEHRQWERLLNEIGTARMNQPGVVAQWSMKDLIAHLTGWNRALVAHFAAAQHGDSEASLPWPARLQNDDDINAWIYETYQDRSVRDILEESEQVFQRLMAAVATLPDDVQIETVRTSPERAYYLVWVGDERFEVGEFFDHFQDDHEADVRAWLARTTSS
jgi:hypothetical protein